MVTVFVWHFNTQARNWSNSLDFLIVF